MIETCLLDTPLGAMRAAAEDGAICGLWFEGQKYYPADAASWTHNPDLPIFALLYQWLEAYFAGGAPEIHLPLAPRGTAFQQAVWDILLAIPPGSGTTYGAIAREMAARMGRESMSAQAVGGAVGHNPISVVIPCHRVMGADGSLTGYAGGLERKKALLRLEGWQM